MFLLFGLGPFDLSNAILRSYSKGRSFLLTISHTDNPSKVSLIFLQARIESDVEATMTIECVWVGDTWLAATSNGGVDLYSEAFAFTHTLP